MRTWKELKNRVPIFLTEAWERRKEAIRKRVEKKRK